MNSEVRDLKEPELIKKSAQEAIKSIEALAKQNHTEIPMSEIVKILIWEKENLYEIQHYEMMKEVEKDKREGWKVESHTFYGENFDTYHVPLRYN